MKVVVHGLILALTIALVGCGDKKTASDNDNAKTNPPGPGTVGPGPGNGPPTFPGPGPGNGPRDGGGKPDIPGNQYLVGTWDGSMEFDAKTAPPGPAGEQFKAMIKNTKMVIEIKGDGTFSETETMPDPTKKGQFITHKTVGKWKVVNDGRTRMTVQLSAKPQGADKEIARNVTWSRVNANTFNVVFDPNRPPGKTIYNRRKATDNGKPDKAKPNKAASN